MSTWGHEARTTTGRVADHVEAARARLLGAVQVDWVSPAAAIYLDRLSEIAAGVDTLARRADACRDDVLRHVHAADAAVAGALRVDQDAVVGWAPEVAARLSR
ncbi:hypothetical protein [Cellulomonas carbonis]|uniref:Uncharacterized protein n=1 Tax=Cellulomonas carbonis T26 TaxID=947969 RepID=A0A0A0BT33_9CELL|nr:hypothetical protein [Cellulomonas carbonis]KGM11593.1 hypothetical protein N868_05355 [Cellulomonas carbonis T26]GGC06648.1 hypothetical protein GCM10010972_19850 [Cellulomonas carbonis]